MAAGPEIDIWPPGTFREDLIALLHKHGMPKTTERFIIRPDGYNEPVRVECVFAPEFEAIVEPRPA